MYPELVHPAYLVWYFYIAATEFEQLCFRPWYFGLAAYLNFVIGFIQVCYFIAIVIFISFFMSFILYSWHCFVDTFVLIQLFSKAVSINTIISTIHKSVQMHLQRQQAPKFLCSKFQVISPFVVYLACNYNQHLKTAFSSNF